MLSYEDARSLVFEHVKPLGKRNCPLAESQGLALSEDILAPHGLPLFDNSANHKKNAKGTFEFVKNA